MLRFKGEQLLSIAFRHLAYSVCSTARESAMEQFGSNCNDGLKLREVYAVVGEHCAKFNDNVLKLARLVEEGKSPEPRLLVLTIESTYYRPFVRDVIGELVSKFNEKISRDFDEAIVEYASILSAVNIAQFIDTSCESKNQVLAQLLDEHRLSLWSVAFRNETWNEVLLKHEINNGLPDVVEAVVRNECDEETKPDINDLVQKVLQIVDNEFFTEYLNKDLRDTAQSKLVPNDSLTDLLSTIPDVVNHVRKKLDSYLSEIIREELVCQINERDHLLGLLLNG